MHARRQLFWLCFVVLGSCTSLFSSGLGNDPGVPTADFMIQELQSANLRREKALRSYTGRRIYEVSYHGILGSRHAKMIVDVSYEYPGEKKFTIVSQDGSKLLLKRVLLRLLDSEKEALEEKNRARTALTSQNYSFSLQGVESTPQGTFYVLKVEPKVRNKFLYRGKIWIDSRDFAVTQIEGEPAKNPSWWIRRTQIEHHYAKLGEFWLPLHNQSMTQIRLGGKAVLTIEYLDYQITSTAPVDSQPARSGH